MHRASGCPNCPLNELARQCPCEPTPDLSPNGCNVPRRRLWMRRCEVPATLTPSCAAGTPGNPLAPRAAYAFAFSRNHDIYMGVMMRKPLWRVLAEYIWDEESFLDFGYYGA